MGRGKEAPLKMRRKQGQHPRKAGEAYRGMVKKNLQKTLVRAKLIFLVYD